MKWIVALSLLMSGSQAFAVEGDLGRFLKACAWGTAIGAATGVVTLAFESKPSEHTVNVARGASLGLYGGIAYGLLQMNPEVHVDRMNQSIGWIAPSIKNGSVDGLKAEVLVTQF